MEIKNYGDDDLVIITHERSCLCCPRPHYRFHQKEPVTFKGTKEWLVGKEKTSLRNAIIDNFNKTARKTYITDDRIDAARMKLLQEMDDIGSIGIARHGQKIHITLTAQCKTAIVETQHTSLKPAGIVGQ